MVATDTVSHLLFVLLVLGLAAAVFLVARRPGRPQYQELDKLLRKPARPTAPPHSIFISYRRKDTESTVGRLYEHLTEAYGRDAVFKDVDAISLGQDFREALERALAQCQVFLCVMGTQWMGATPAGGRAIDTPSDFVRMEIETALSRGILVIPVLVDNFGIPSPDALPGSLDQLPFRQAQPLRADPDFRNDVARLCALLDARFAETSRTVTPAASYGLFKQ